MCADAHTGALPCVCLCVPLSLPQHSHKVVFKSGVPDASSGDRGQPEAVPGGLLEKVLRGENRNRKVQGLEGLPI